MCSFAQSFLTPWGPNNCRSLGSSVHRILQERILEQVAIFYSLTAVSILGLGRFPRDRNGSPLQFACLENPMDRGAWQATVHGIAKETQLSTKQ